MLSPLPASNMTIPKALVLITLSLLCNATFSQLQLTQKQYLIAAIKESIGDDYALNRTWTTCNTDSTFAKADTIRLYNNKNYQTRKGCCNYVNWKFVNDTSLKQNFSSPCTEPPGESVYFDDRDLFTLKVIEANNALFLQTFQNGSLKDNFKVFSIRSTKIPNGQLTKELTLIRAN